MTREEALGMVFSEVEPYVVHHKELEIDSKYLHRKAVLQFVNKLYDDFKLELEAEYKRGWNDRHTQRDLEDTVVEKGLFDE